MSGRRLRKSTPPLPKIVVETAESVSAPFSLLVVKKAHAAAASFDGERSICLDVTIEARNDDGEPEQRRYVLELAQGIDPYLLAADLQAVADDVLRRAAIDAGLDHRQTEATLREARRIQRIARRQLRDGMGTAPASTCAFCPRTTSFVIDGVRYCKRCAEEHGVRPHGKIGAEQHDEELRTGRDPRD